MHELRPFGIHSAVLLNALPRVTTERLIDELHAELGHVMVQCVGVITNLLYVGIRVFQRLAIEWRNSAKSTTENYTFYRFSLSVHY
jgi:hypothetical protein